MKRRPTSEDVPESLAEAIKAGRAERGWSQSKLARLLEATETSVQTWESSRGYPSFALYSRMCLLFEWPLPYSGDSPTARESSFADWPSALSPNEASADLALTAAPA